MSGPRDRRERNDILERFDVLVVALRFWIQRRGGERLIGVLPELETLRHQFEIATAPDGTNDRGES